MRRRGFGLYAMSVGAAVVSGCRRPSAGASTNSRLVVAGGALTEIVFALGVGASVVGVDSSSTYPPEARALQQVGYQRQLAVEQVLSLAPTMLLASSEAGPPEVLAQIEQSGVRVATVESPHDVAAITARIRLVGDLIERGAQAQQLETATQTVLSRLEARAAARTGRPRILFVYARGPNTTLVGGSGTPADIVIRLSGCDNAAAEVVGFKPFSSEGAIAARPDVLLLPEQGLSSLGGIDGVLGLPGMSRTNIASTRQVVAIDDQLLLGLGPRVGAAVEAIVTAVFGEEH